MTGLMAVCRTLATAWFPRRLLIITPPANDEQQRRKSVACRTLQLPLQARR